MVEVHGHAGMESKWTEVDLEAGVQDAQVREREVDQAERSN